jgi:hypothetical protein
MIEHPTGEIPFQLGQRVRLRTPSAFANSHPLLTIVEIDRAAGRAKIRHDPPAGGKGVAYLFWYPLDDLEGGDS